ncbi:hypothetical protein FVER53590_25961 [Fusarium verticillioides]|nr:hypothetical protein FVER53590_25961 [Fusarium verticillioides]
MTSFASLPGSLASSSAQGNRISCILIRPNYDTYPTCSCAIPRFPVVSEILRLVNLSNREVATSTIHTYQKGWALTCMLTHSRSRRCDFLAFILIRMNA